MSSAEFCRQIPTLLPRFKRFAVRMTRNPQDADDVVQAACERALSSIDQWDPNSRLDSWMFRIMQTIWYNERRARMVRAEYANREQAQHGESDQTTLGAQHLLFCGALEISRLPKELRSLLILACIKGLTYQEAAYAMAIPVGTVMSRLARARLILVQRLGLPVKFAGPRADCKKMPPVKSPLERGPRLGEACSTASSED